jgi:photosystem II stability/assembly factor-like uncharacterized protein
MMKTEDSGKSWKMAARRDECGQDVFFVNKDIGWFYRTSDYVTFLCRTEDGGRTRQKQDVGMNVWQVFFVDTSTGWAVGTMEERNKQGELEKVYGVINHTIDGGKTWTTQFSELMGKDRVGTGLFGVFFLDINTGWVVGEQGTILYTEDRGKHWQRQKSGTSQLHLSDIHFVNPKIGWIAGTKISNGWLGVILHTEDGGNNWLTQYKLENVSFYSLFFTNNIFGWVTGASEHGSAGWLLHTDDGGRKWTKGSYGYMDYSYIAFRDKQNGAISSDKGWLIITTNGGKTWEKIRRPIRNQPWHFSEIFAPADKSK